MLSRIAKENVKYTAILRTECLKELRKMAEKKVIPSVNQGIRSAVEDFVKTHRMSDYHQGILEAANDKAFIKRTIDSQKAYQFVDAETESQW